MISCRADLFRHMVNKEHGIFRGHLSLTLRNGRGYRNPMWIVTKNDFQGADLPDKVREGLSQALAETGAEDLPGGYGFEIIDDDQAPSIEDHLDTLIENMEGHDFFSVRYDKGEREATILYEIEV